MDQAQIRERYHDDDFSTAGGWPLSTEGYQAPHMISPGQEYHDFTFSTGAVPVTQMYGTPPIPQHSFAPTWPSILASSPHGNAGQMQSGPPMTPIQQYLPPQPLPPLVTTAPAHSHQQQQQQQQQQPHVQRQSQPPAPPPPPQPQSSSRRTLTDQDRRRMCQFHEDNPTVKQTEIGAMFGVERSTVSKVLRQKEKYLAVEDGSKSPIRRAKGKFPDIERALTNWANKHHSKGIQLTDEQIRDKARFFAASVGNPEASLKVSSPSWLEKFKQKNQIGGSKHKKGSIASAELNRAQRQNSQTPSGISPISPSGSGLEPSPMTPGGERSFDGKHDSPVTDVSGTSRLMHSKSAASLASALSDTPSTFSTANAPPMPVPYGQKVRLSQQNDTTRMMPPTNIDPFTSSHRPRSQTFPMLGVEGAHLGIESTGFTDAQMEDIMASSGLDTPQEEYVGRSLSVASLSSAEVARIPHSQPPSIIETPGIEHSPLVMGPPTGSIHYPGSATSSAIASPLGHPTLDEGRRGLEMAMGFLTTLPSGMVDPNDYVLLNKLMEKLNTMGSSGGGEMPGGMHPIDVKKDMTRKGSIQSL